MTNYEKYFGTPERAAESMAFDKKFSNAWNDWVDNDGALLCAMTPTRGSNNTKHQIEAFQVFLEAEAKEES